MGLIAKGLKVVCWNSITYLISRSFISGSSLKLLAESILHYRHNRFIRSSLPREVLMQYLLPNEEAGERRHDTKAQHDHPHAS